MSILPENETDAQFFARLDAEYLAERARLIATYPLMPFEPTATDHAEYARWSQSVQDHDDALDFWLGFFDCDEAEERSTFFVE